MDFNHEKIFSPVIGVDAMLQNGVSLNVSTKHMAITIMEKFKNKSFEELHLENYNARKSSFDKTNKGFSVSKTSSMDDTVTNENNIVIKDLVDELVSTLCKLILKMNLIPANNSTLSAANETQSKSFPSAGIKITPSSVNPPKFDPFLANFPFTFNTTTMMSTEPSTNETNSSKFNCAPPTNNFSFTPTTKSFFTTPIPPTVNDTTTFAPTQSNKNFFSLPNTNSKASTNYTWPSSPFTKSVFAPKQSSSSETSTTETTSTTSNPIFQLTTATSSFSKPSGFIFNPTTSSSYFSTKTSTTQSESSTNKPTLSNHSCWAISPDTNRIYNKCIVPHGIFDSLPSSSFNNNAKTSANSFNFNSNVENHSSFSTQPPFTLFREPTSSNSNSINNATSKKSENKVTDEKKELDDDEFVSSIVNCLKTLQTIASVDQKSKLIGIYEQSGTAKINILKSAFVQLQVMESRSGSFKKFAFVSESAGILNTTIKANILRGNTFNAQLYYSAIVLCCLKDDIDSLPIGDLTQVGDNGVELSDAQKQKIALARAFYANQNIYFLNNAFKKIDSKDARFIFEALILGALKEKTIILMDDKPCYFNHCDKVYIINKGVLAEESDHKSLLEKNKCYASLVKKYDITEDDQSSDANKNSIASAPQVSQDTFEISSINKKIQDIQVQANENDNTELKTVIQEKALDTTKQVDLVIQHHENLHYIMKKSEMKENNEQESINSPKIQNENQISIIETKTPDQQDDKHEKQLDEPAKDETDGQSINVENDFEIF